MCCSPWDFGEPDGECEECGAPTVDGDAATGCDYSPTLCATCGDAPCDLSC